MSTTPGGQISARDVEIVLNGGVTIQYPGGTSTLTFNDYLVRTLAGKPSGRISMDDMRNKEGPTPRGTVTATATYNLADYTVDVRNLSGYVAGSSDITLTVNSGVYVYSTNTTNAGLTIIGTSGGDVVTLVNKGYIMGKGGNGGGGGSSTYPTAGGPAIECWCPLIIDTRNGYIGGGGGGGGNSGFAQTYAGGGGGAGGGNGGIGAVNGSSTYSVAGSGGGPGGTGTTGTFNSAANGNAGGRIPGGGGGRILPGTGGAGASTSTANNGSNFNGTFDGGLGGGAGGGGGASGVSENGGNGGSGGSPGSQGGTGDDKGTTAGGGGGWGASGGSGFVYSTYTNAPFANSGAAGGKAVNLNGRSITWTGGYDGSRVFGAVS